MLKFPFYIRFLVSFQFQRLLRLLLIKKSKSHRIHSSAFILKKTLPQKRKMIYIFLADFIIKLSHIYAKANNC